MSTSKTISKSASNLAYRLKAIRDFDFQKETREIVNQNSGFLIGLLRIQLASGKDGNNENVKVFGRNFYADRTVFEKEKPEVFGLGRQTSWITNYMSGAFYSQLRINTQGRGFAFTSDVPYFEDILIQSGKIIMELNKQHVQEFTKDILIPTLKQRLKNRTNGS